jgi:hypothetical protein
MKEIKLSVPEVMALAGTRALLGAGLGLLIAPKLSKEMRRTMGRTLLAIGVVSTVPLVREVLRKAS